MGRRSVSVLNPIVSAGENLQHQLAQGHVCGGEPAGEQTHQRLRAFDQRLHSLVAVVTFRVGGKVGQVLFCLRIDLFPCLLEQRLIEAAIA